MFIVVICSHACLPSLLHAMAALMCICDKFPYANWGNAMASQMKNQNRALTWTERQSSSFLFVFHVPSKTHNAKAIIAIFIHCSFPNAKLIRLILIITPSAVLKYISNMWKDECLDIKAIHILFLIEILSFSSVSDIEKKVKLSVWFDSVINIWSLERTTTTAMIIITCNVNAM